jgi:hypothetical protein
MDSPIPTEAVMPRKPTADDARLILQLYDLRREPEMRKARNWCLVTFWPNTLDDISKVENAFGTQENNWFRQVIGYWELAASLVLHRTLNEKLFLEQAFSGEMFVVFTKVHPFLKEWRVKTQYPALLGNVEKVIMRTKTGRDRLEMMIQRVAARRKTLAASAAKSG